jgi:hypothetical protein
VVKASSRSRRGEDRHESGAFGSNGRDPGGGLSGLRKPQPHRVQMVRQ